MKKIVGFIIAIVLLILGCMKSEVAGQSEQGEFMLVTFSAEDGGKVEASLFEASAEKVIIYAHGAVFNKESWYFLAERFQKIGISSLSIDFRGYGNSSGSNPGQKYNDILGAIDYLKDKGYGQIYIIGGSMGGAAVLDALNRLESQTVAKVVLLAPAGGPAISSSAINKLFVVSKNEGLYTRVKTVFETSAEPKIFKEFNGSAHAQHMFKEDYAEDLITLIMDFMEK
jgi:alpha-beta hydrolase superfamily lysophospholipase